MKVTISNTSKRKLPFIPYNENFVTYISPKSSIEMEVNTAAEAIYYQDQSKNGLEIDSMKEVIVEGSDIENPFLIGSEYYSFSDIADILNPSTPYTNKNYCVYVKLMEDVVIDTTIIVSTKAYIDLNGHTISNEKDIWDESLTFANWSLISVRGIPKQKEDGSYTSLGSGELTITGNGTLKAKANDCYAVDVMHRGCKCTIENGVYYGNISAIYVFGGILVINGGKFYIQQLLSKYPYSSLLNINDGALAERYASITCYGGSYQNFNPAVSSDGSLVASGYKVTSAMDSSENIMYSVVKR